MEGIDDGKNRVGGDLLLMIFNALRKHGYEIPFPQREVRVLNPNFNVGPLQKAGNGARPKLLNLISGEPRHALA